MKPVVCVDLDGTLAKFDEWQGVDHFGDPFPGAVEFTKKLSDFFDVCIYTCRCNEKINPPEKSNLLKNRVRDWLDEHGFVYSHIYAEQGKPIAHAYIDDKGISCQPDLNGEEAYNMVLRILGVLGSPQVEEVATAIEVSEEMDKEE